MKHTRKLFEIGLKQIAQDGMLLILIAAPFLVGMFFRFVIPFINTILINEFSFPIIPWYGLADGMLICMTPMFVAMISAFLLFKRKRGRRKCFLSDHPGRRLFLFACAYWIADDRGICNHIVCFCCIYDFLFIFWGDSFRVFYQQSDRNIFGNDGGFHCRKPCGGACALEVDGD